MTLIMFILKPLPVLQFDFQALTSHMAYNISDKALTFRYIEMAMISTVLKAVIMLSI